MFPFLTRVCFRRLRSTNIISIVIASTRLGIHNERGIFKESRIFRANICCLFNWRGETYCG